VEKKVEDEKPTPAELRAQKRKAAERRRQAQLRAQAGQREARRGTAHGSPQASSLSRGDYAALLLAELRRRQFYPAAPRGPFQHTSIRFHLE
jgi:periplasmic protein TonB